MDNEEKKSLRWLWITLSIIIVLGLVVWCVFNAINGKKQVDSIFKFTQVVALLFGIFLVACLGYLLGRISIKGVSLGTAGVFLIAILFGYLCTIKPIANIPILSNFYIENSNSVLDKYYKKIVQNIGLILFVASVGFIAGPSFFKNLKKNAKSYVLLGLIIILTGGLVAVLFTLIPGITSSFSAGVLSGALTSTPGYSAALEVAKESEDIITLGHAIAYPFGVIGVVLFVQLIPKILKVNMDEERHFLKISAEEKSEDNSSRFVCDVFGLMPFALAVIAGLVLGSITIPLSGKGYDGPCFSLGNTGGVLIMCLIFGHFGHIGKLSLKVPENTAKIFREFGLMLFLIGAGVSGGVSLVSEISKSELGAMLVVYGFLGGMLMTIIPMIIGFIFAKYVLKISLLNNLGSITGGMTSTPALGTLIHVAETDDVASAYAATYPISLVAIVLVSQFLILLF